MAPAKRSALLAAEPARSSKSAKKEPKKAIKSPLNTAPTQRLEIYVFGSGEYGELGLGHLRRNGKMPRDVKRPRLNDLLDANDVGVVQLDVGGMHCVALTHDNKIITWGVNDNGALGRDTTWAAPEKDIDEDEDDEDSDDTGMNPKESTPEAIPADTFDPGVVFVQVAATDSASFALTEGGKVYGWGTFRGNDGVIGFSKSSLARGEKVQRTPALIPELSNIVHLAAGGNHIQALDKKGNVFSWGSGEQGQLGRHVMESYRAQALTPSQFGLPKSRIKQIACGAYHSFAIDNRENVYAWGLSNFGQTGIPAGAGKDNATVTKPKIVEALENFTILDIQGGTHHSIACTEEGKTLVWGRCDDSQAGIPMEDLPKDDLIFNERGQPAILVKPTIVPGVKANSVAAAIDDCLLTTKSGAAFSWGFGSNYRTGQGTENSITEATEINNSAVKGKILTFAGCGGMFSVLAGPAVPSPREK